MAEVSFGEWLKRRRKLKGPTQEELAQQINCSVSSLRKFEAERRRPSEQIVELLAETFDVPSHERGQFLKFARGDWEAAPGETKEDAPWHVSTLSPRSNLPETVTSLIGREKEIEEVRAYLLDSDIRLVTLTGPPGIGETRLCLDFARTSFDDFSDGVFFVALAPLEDPTLIPSTIIQALGYIEVKSQAADQQLKVSIGDKKMLLILDNCEHLIEEVASLASMLLSACPRLKIMATSRESLRIPGEWLYAVPVLDVPKEETFINIESIAEFSALTLFAECARAVRSDFALNSDNIQSIASICRQLDGLPLAIELLAARTLLLSPQTIQERLNVQFALYTDGMRAVPKRQKSLHNAIAWSYDLLSEEEKKLFVYLSVFAAGFTLEASESIFSSRIAEKSIANLISSLLDKSLLQRTFDASGDARFNLLVTIRQFALNRLHSIEEEEKARDWHLAYFLELAEEADREIHGLDQVEWLDRLEREHENLRAALKWCVSEQKTETALRLLTALGWTWFLRDHTREFRTWFSRTCDLSKVSNCPALYAELLTNQGMHCWLVGDFREAQSTLTKAQKIWLTLGVEGELGLAKTLNLLEMTAGAGEGDNLAEKTFCERSLALYQKHENLWGMANVMANLGEVENLQDDNAQAFSLFKGSLDLFQQLGDGWGTGRVSHLLGYLFLKQGNYEKAQQCFDQLLRHREGHKYGTIVAFAALGDVYRYQHDYDQAEYYYEKSLSTSRKHGLYAWGSIFYSLAMLALHRDNYPLARQYFMDYCDLHHNSFKKVNACDFLMGLAAVAAGTNQPEPAGKLYGAAQALFETADYRIPSFDQTELDRHIQIAHTQLGEATFESFAAEGRSMTLEEAFEFALEGKDE